MHVKDLRGEGCRKDVVEGLNASYLWTLCGVGCALTMAFVISMQRHRPNIYYSPKTLKHDEHFEDLELEDGYITENGQWHDSQRQKH